MFGGNKVDNEVAELINKKNKIEKTFNHFRQKILPFSSKKLFSLRLTREG